MSMHNINHDLLTYSKGNEPVLYLELRLTNKLNELRLHQLSVISDRLFNQKLGRTFVKHLIN